MTQRSRNVFIIVFVIALLIAVVAVFFLVRAADRIPVHPTPTGYADAELVEHEGKVVIRAKADDGEWRFLEPQTYFDQVYAERQQRGFGSRLIMKLFNISSPATAWWVLLGFVGQLLFAGRMVVQWVATERRRKSVIPTAFWWLALSGASMLLIYFVWRKDIVGVLGQSLGWVIYVRNLYFIYGKHHPEQTMIDSDLEEERAKTAQDDG